MRVLILSQWFTPETTLLKPFGEGLRTRGHEVFVLTGFPNYPSGKVFPGYKIRLWQRDNVEGIPVLRVPLYPSHDASAIRRVLNYTSFALSAASIGIALSKTVDIIYVYHPPATVGLPAMLFRWFRGTPFVYHIQDMWPDTLTATGMFNNKAGLRIIDRWCKLVYKQASRIVVISPGFKELLVKRGVPPDKIDLIYNWCDEGSIGTNEYDQKLAESLGFAGKFNILFAGTIGLAQALDAVIGAAKILDKKIPQIQFVFVGGGIESHRLESRAREEEIKNVKFFERRPLSEIGAMISLADVLLVHLKDDPLFRITVPGKTQAYMWSGKPILMGVKGDAHDLVMRAKSGLSCEPEDPKSIADAAERFYLMSPEERETMGRNGRRFYERELSLNVAVEKFERIFESVTGLNHRAKI